MSGSTNAREYSGRRRRRILRRRGQGAGSHPSWVGWAPEGTCAAGVGRARCAAQAHPPTLGFPLLWGLAPLPPRCCSPRKVRAPIRPPLLGERVGVRGLARRCSCLDRVLRPRGFRVGAWGGAPRKGARGAAPHPLMAGGWAKPPCEASGISAGGLRTPRGAQSASARPRGAACRGRGRRDRCRAPRLASGPGRAAAGRRASLPRRRRPR